MKPHIHMDCNFCSYLWPGMTCKPMYMWACLFIIYRVCVDGSNKHMLV